MENNSPQSIGIIIDGNRRWAREHGVSVGEGHAAGLEKTKEFLAWAKEKGVKEVIVYVFSTENWNRSKEEIDNFLDLVDRGIEEWSKVALEKDIKMRIIGQRDRLSDELKIRIGKAEEKTKNGKEGTVAFAFSYGGRAEILSAVNKLLIEGRDVVTEEELRGAMWSADLRDPDLIIRTGGDKRLSNFLPWQAVYSELFFIDTKWPDFSKEEFEEVLSEFARREKRVGK
jgi:undecaprenyl diphosphate synthase